VNVRITGTGSALPMKIHTNAEPEHIIQTRDDLIISGTLPTHLSACIVKDVIAATRINGIQPFSTCAPVR